MTSPVRRLGFVVGAAGASAGGAAGRLRRPGARRCPRGGVRAGGRRIPGRRAVARGRCAVAGGRGVLAGGAVTVAAERDPGEAVRWLARVEPAGLPWRWPGV